MSLPSGCRSSNEINTSQARWRLGKETGQTNRVRGKRARLGKRSK
ncbi:hypothetical protein HanPI659440_Chr12g0464591 [Helianthus annuus]|nr:hypothetical protein HanPI659440_Chr12g0464591 [Helianthus annuus]